MGMTVEQIKRLTVRGDTQGLDKMKADLAGVDAAQRQVAASSAAVNSSTKTATGSVISAQREYERLSRSIDPVARAQAAFDRGLRVTNAALAQGAIGIEQQQRSMGILRQRLDDARAASMQHAGSVNLQRGAMQQLSFQVNDMATMLASGSSPFQVMATQGGQVFQILQQGPQGVGGSIKGIVSSLAGMITPTRLALGGVTALAAVGLAAWNSWDNKIKDVQRSLNGLGSTTGTTSTSIMDAAARASRGGSITPNAALSGATLFASSGIFPSVSGGLVTASRQMAGATGESVSETQKMLAGAFAAPSQGFAELSKRMGDLGLETERQIKRLESQGRFEEAQQTLLSAFNDRLKNTTDTTGMFATGMEKAQGWWNTFWNNLGKIGAPQSAQEALEGARRGERRAIALGIDPEPFRRDRIEAEKRVAEEDARTQKLLADANRLREQRVQQDRERIGVMGDLSGQSVTARTSSERLAIEQEKLRREAIYDTTRTNTLAAETERARTQAVAEATRAMMDYNRMVKDEAFTGGARTERDQFIRRMQLENRDLRERTDVLPPNEQWRSQLKYSERAAPQQAIPNPFGDDMNGPFGTMPLGLSFKVKNDLTRRLEEVIGEAAAPAAMAAARRSGGLPPAGIARELTVTRRASGDAPGPIDDARLAAWDKNKFEQMIFDTNVGIEAQRKALEASTRTFGMSTEEIARNNEVVRLTNETIRIGIPLTEERRAAIEATAIAEGRLAAARERAQEQQQKLIQSMDFLRSSTNDLISSPLKALARGENAGKAFQQAGQRMGERMIDMGVGSITEMLLGKNGKAGGWMLGGLLGLGDQNTANMQVTAGSVMIVGGVSGIGGGGGLLGGLFSGLFGGGGSANDTDDWMPSARGNVFSAGNLVPFAKGGVIVAGPRTFPLAGGKTGLMGEAGPEAIMPVGRDSAGRLGVVVAQREREAANNNSAPSIAYRGGDLIVQGNVTDDVLPKVRLMIAESNKSMDRNLRRNFGSYQQRAQENYST